MTRKFQIKAVPSSWLENNGRRLDCGPYMSGAVEARELLKRHKTEPLKTLTVERNGGIFNGPRFPRVYVDDPVHGVPFLGSTDILDADLSDVSFLSKKQVDGNPALVIDEGWTLITCSGTIGRMAYARSDMKGMAGSQHFMRVAPDESKIASGYLYAYLSSRFGVPIIVSGTYGAIIQHIEPQHIADLPVPRLGAVEDQAHELIQQAADKRVQASRIVSEAIGLLGAEAGLQKIKSNKVDGIPFSAGAISSSSIIKRMDGAFHSLFHREALDTLGGASVPMTTVSKMSVSIVEPKRFKRIQINDPEFGVPMFGTSALMCADPQPSYLIPKSMSGVDELLIDQKAVLIPRSGQVSGIIGTAVLPYGALIGGAVSEDAIRIHCATDVIAGFLFIVLRSEYGRRQLKARAYGSSIPHLDVSQIGQILVPDLQDGVVEEIGTLGLQSARLRHEAINHENEARTLVERAIEEGGR